MAIKFVSIKCPDCGSALDVEEGRKQLFCSYCGAKVIIDNENEYTFRHIDEAQVKEAETNQMVQLKKLEILEKKRIASEKSKKVKIFWTVILVLIALLSIGIGFGTDTIGFAMPGMVCCYILMIMWANNDKEDSENFTIEDSVVIPKAISDYQSKDYKAIETLFVSAGFKNVKTVPLNDLTLGLIYKPDRVDSITVNGKTITSGGAKCSPDVSVVITYHSHI